MRSVTLLSPISLEAIKWGVSLEMTAKNAAMAMMLWCTGVMFNPVDLLVFIISSADEF